MRVRSRGRDTQRLLRNEPAARAKETGNPPQGPDRIGLVHQEQPRIGQIERAAQRGGIQFVEVTCDDLHVAELKGRHHLPRPLDRRRVEVDAYDPAGGPDRLRHDRKPADGAAAAVDRRPPLLHTEPAERRAGHPRADLSDAQQPPKVFVAAVEDVTPDPPCDCFSHAPVPGSPARLARSSCASYMFRSSCCSECAWGVALGSVITSLAGGGVSVTCAPYAEKLSVPLLLIRRISGLLEIET